MHLKAYLYFNGNCEAAFKFYEQCLGGKIEAITPYEGSPAALHVSLAGRLPEGCLNSIGNHSVAFAPTRE